MTVTHLADFDSRPLTYTVVHPDGSRSFVPAADAATVLAALIPGYESLKPHARLAARRKHAQTVRVALQRRVNANAKANGTWAILTDAERAELTQAATGAAPTGVIRDDDWIGTWDGPVPLVISRVDYGLLAESGDWIEEPVGDNLLVLDSTDDDAYLESLEHVGIATLTDGHAVA